MDKGVKEDHMFNTYNMGIGLVLAVDKTISSEILTVLSDLGEEAYEIGYVQAGGGGVCLK